MVSSSISVADHGNLGQLHARFLAIVPATGLAWLGILVYFELRDQHHIWHDPCITPASRRGS